RSPRRRRRSPRRKRSSPTIAPWPTTPPRPTAPPAEGPARARPRSRRGATIVAAGMTMMVVVVVTMAVAMVVAMVVVVAVMALVVRPEDLREDAAGPLAEQGCEEHQPEQHERDHLHGRGALGGDVVEIERRQLDEG